MTCCSSRSAIPSCAPGSRPCRAAAGRQRRHRWSRPGRSHTHTAQVNGRSLQLTPFECRLLVTVARKPDQVFTREQLLCSIWGIDTGRSRTLDSHAVRLRCKLRDAGAGQLVHNVWGVGYAFTKPETDGEAT
jgi:DNA-binding response OmpR family regulator